VTRDLLVQSRTSATIQQVIVVTDGRDEWNVMAKTGCRGDVFALRTKTSNTENTVHLPLCALG